MTVARAAAVVAAFAILAVLIAWGPLGGAFEHVVSVTLNTFVRGGGSDVSGPRLFLVAFGGGLIASISPCILGMLPINISYIGASKVRSRGEAVAKATAFVAGVGVVNVVLGLASSLFFAIFIAYRGQVDIAVGLITVVLGLWMLGIVRVSLPNFVTTIPVAAGPFIVGIVFALIASPCASPVLIAVLTAASSSGSLLRAAAAMIVYTIGYTAILWLATVFAGVLVASRALLHYGEMITRIGATALLLLGIGTAIVGVRLLV